jgi:hypothetical protein
VNDNIRAIWNRAASSHQQAETSRETQENFLNRFAELIVRECIAICKDVDGEDNIDARSGRHDCAVEIQEHFGVGE